MTKPLIELVEEYGKKMEEAAYTDAFAGCDEAMTVGADANALLSEIRQRLETYESLLREAYGYTTAANNLLPERIKAALAGVPTPKESSPVAAQDGEAVLFGVRNPRHEFDITYRSRVEAEAHIASDETGRQLELVPLHPPATVEALRAERDENHRIFMRAVRQRDEAESELAALQQRFMELAEATAEVVRISDRKHDAWDRVKALLAAPALQQRLVDLEARPVAVVVPEGFQRVLLPDGWVQMFDLLVCRQMGIQSATDPKHDDAITDFMRKVRAVNVAPARTITPERLAELEANERRYLWQPIETAPQGHDLHMLFEPHEQGGFIFVGCRNLRDDWINNLDLKTQQPTHWMPLPAAPDAAIDASAAQEKAG